ncbi:S8 family serine peptidase [Sphingosinicella sp. LHD-64]|uniref:S8 family serine peptidase n=1 Tax=Sphingosinicella sp. LHD-64 TaxID=3072139 RepID=UPI00281087F1|nr:S8 family serine peptidase [Sphingosinicella sp. LHD-64]MDQ8754717.1 S8 family serine peptidase [Sphingosinicella sp. LHD-64]
MKPFQLWIGFAALAALGGAVQAQLVPPVQVPPVGGVIGGVGQTGRDVLDTATGAVDDVRTSARDLAGARLRRLEDLVRRNPDLLEMTDLGPAVRGEVVAVDPDSSTISAAEAAGFVRREETRLEGLDIRAVTFQVPRGWSVDRALSRLRRIAPDATFTANHLHGQSGEVAGGGGALTQGSAGPGAIGLIDGGVAAHPALRGPVRQQGFVRGAPWPSAHGTAVASLISGQGSVRGAAPGAPLLVADIFGVDPAGGNAVALVRALGWLAQQRVQVVAVSLVGPANALVARAVAQARARGMFIVAAVGNDGRAAPPAYPASYDGVIAVTGVDARNRPLIEAGRALHLDYAAPGADMAAAGANGRLVPVRGTSYAVPFVAGRLSQHLGRPNPIAALDAEANPRGRGLGRGVICGDCRTPRRRD